MLVAGSMKAPALLPFRLRSLDALINIESRCLFNLFNCGAIIPDKASLACLSMKVCNNSKVRGHICADRISVLTDLDLSVED